MLVCEVIKELDVIAPPWLAEDGDSIGLQVGSVDQPVNRIAVTVDASPKQIQSALRENADLIISHHPLISTPLKTLVEGDPIAGTVMKLVRANASFFVLHTNYDIAPSGVSDVLAEVLGVVNTEPLTHRRQDSWFKIVVFVPEEAIDDVRSAMAQAGAGVIGDYTYCSFRTAGTGSFLPSDRARPYIGESGRLEEIAELRLEMLCAGSKCSAVTEAMMAAHPYEEVAYDVYPLANACTSYGLGRVGSLDAPLPLSEFVERVRAELKPKCLRVTGDADRLVRQVAVCGGSGSSLYDDAVRLGADVYVTGDVKHHDALAADALGLAVIDAGHFETERPGMLALAAKLKAWLGDKDAEVVFLE